MSDAVDSELHAQVKSIVDELEAAASGSLYEVDGDYVVIDDVDEWKKEQYGKEADRFVKTHDGTWDEDLYDSFDEFMEDEIGTVDDIDEPGEVSLSEYIDDRALGDVRFEVDLSKELYGGKVLFCFGGPNIWVADDEVRGYWGGSSCEMTLDSDTRSALWDWFERQWDAVKEG